MGKVMKRIRYDELPPEVTTLITRWYWKPNGVRMLSKKLAWAPVRVRRWIGKLGLDNPHTKSTLKRKEKEGKKKAPPMNKKALNGECPRCSGKAFGEYWRDEDRMRCICGWSQAFPWRKEKNAAHRKAKS